jgi:hypothetical protein
MPTKPFLEGISKEVDGKIKSAFGGDAVLPVQELEFFNKFGAQGTHFGEIESALYKSKDGNSGLVFQITSGFDKIMSFLEVIRAESKYLT